MVGRNFEPAPPEARRINRCRLSFYRYAAYGSNLHPLRLQKRAPSAVLIGTSLLRGYELRFNKRSWLDGSAKCSITSGECGVHLAIFEIPDSERAFLDRCEGVGCGYDRCELDLDGFGACSSYVAAPVAEENTLRPTDWYKEMVVLGCRYNRFPEEYIASIERIPAIPDLDAERAAREWRLVEQLRGT